MTRFFMGVALGAGATALLLRKRHDHPNQAERTRNNIERTGRALEEMTDRVHRSEQLLHEAEEKASRAHRQTRSALHRRHKQ